MGCWSKSWSFGERPFGVHSLTLTSEFRWTCRRMGTVGQDPRWCVPKVCKRWTTCSYGCWKSDSQGVGSVSNCCWAETWRMGRFSRLHFVGWDLSRSAQCFKCFCGSGKYLKYHLILGPFLIGVGSRCSSDQNVCFSRFTSQVSSSSIAHGTIFPT